MNWVLLGVMADIAQLQSYEILFKDSQNNDLLEVLKRIEKQNEEILNLLKGGDYERRL